MCYKGPLEGVRRCKVLLVCSMFCNQNTDFVEVVLYITIGVSKLEVPSDLQAKPT